MGRHPVDASEGQPACYNDLWRIWSQTSSDRGSFFKYQVDWLPAWLPSLAPVQISLSISVTRLTSNHTCHADESGAQQGKNKSVARQLVVGTDDQSLCIVQHMIAAFVHWSSDNFSAPRNICTVHVRHSLENSRTVTDGVWICFIFFRKKTLIEMARW